jgi:hypothetical protein
MSAELEIQKAIYNELISDSALSSLLAKNVNNSSLPAIYDSVPQVKDSGSDKPFPYITMGDDTLLDWDTDTSNGKEATITIHVWSRYRGKTETKTIQGAIYDVLHLSKINVSGYDTVQCLSEFSETFLDPDGLTRHGVQRFRLIIDKES